MTTRGATKFIELLVAQRIESYIDVRICQKGSKVDAGARRLGRTSAVRRLNANKYMGTFRKPEYARNECLQTAASNRAGYVVRNLPRCT